MKRILFNLAAAISLLLCLAMIGLTLRGMWRIDSLAKYTWDPQLRALKRTEITFTGHLYLRIPMNRGQTASAPVVDQLVVRLQVSGELEWRLFHQETSLEEIPQLLMGFHYYRNSGTLPSGAPWSVFEIEMPYWPLILLSGVMPAVWVVAWRRKLRRDSVGRCRNCGYDLRATPERCPECGTVSVKQK